MRKSDGAFKDKFFELQRRAQVLVAARQNNATAMAPDDIGELVHELSTYQVELELQNEDLRNAQIKLEETRHRYSSLYDFAPVGYLTLSANGLIVEANLTAADMLGVERGRLYKNPISAFIVNDDQDKFYLHRKKLLRSQSPQFCELRLRKKNGAIFYVRMESVVSPEVDGSSGRFRLVINDITERKKLEENLLGSSQEWRDTFDAMSDLVTIHDRDLRIVRANKAAFEFFQVAPEGLHGKHCYELFRETSQPCSDCPELLALKDRKSHIATINFENLGKIFQVTCSPVLDKDGEVARIVHIAKDVTQQKKLEDALSQTHKMEAIGALAGGIAHDFNNILAAMIGYADLAKEGIPAKSRAQKYIDQVLKAGNRAKEMIKQILIFSRKDQETAKKLPIAPVIKDALKLMRASLPTTIEIQEEIDPHCGSVISNPTNIHQVLINLCTNALHAMENEEGLLTVKLRPVELKEKEVRHETGVSAGLFVELMVRDTGGGIDRKIIRRIFEPYYTTKGVGKGSGMGLALVHSIVQGCGGFIKVETALAKETTFWVYFPALEDDHAVVEAVGKESTVPLPKGRERILVVDDEEVLVGLYKAAFEMLGYKLTAMSNSEKAFEEFQAAPESFDLVITDQTMPNLSGSELAKKILQIRPDIPVLLCTGYSSIISEEEAKEIGIERYVMKPASLRDLARTVREVLDKRKV